MDGHRRHSFVWHFLRPILRLFLRIAFNYDAETADVSGPFMLVCNHVTDLDPLMVGYSFRDQIYFIASEHLMRSGLGGRLVRWLQDPIARQKGGSAASSVLSALRRIKAGHSVAFFPEGNRSWDGMTGAFPAATGKMIRSAAAAGASLVTYRIDGGYFASPRWSGASIRKGQCRGQVVRVYSPEELRAMTPAQINDHIAEDIHTDAYAEAREKRIAYRGKHMAEHLETMLWICPLCGGHSTLHSRDDELSCGCGLRVRFLPTGLLEGNAPWDNLTDWYAWQKARIEDLCASEGEDELFSDSEITCSDVEMARNVTTVGHGTMRLFRDRLELPGVTIPLGDIRGASIRSAQDLYIGTDREHYLLHSDEVRCTLRYVTALSLLTGQEFGV